MRLFKPSTSGKPHRIPYRLIIALALVLGSGIVGAQTKLPPDDGGDCSVKDEDFQKWRARNGSFVPPNNVGFPESADECRFFQQAAQMFLWVTSRPARSSSRSHVFGSSSFYAASPIDEKKKRKFIAQGRSNRTSKRTSVSISQLGPGDVPVLFSNTGRMHPIVKVERDRGPPTEEASRKIEIGRIDIQPDKAPLFHDKQGNPIEDPVLRVLGSDEVVEIKQPPGNTITSNGRTFLLDRHDRAIEVDPNRADHNVILAQGSRLVYYMVYLNDVYAYFLTGKENGKIGLNSFPTKQEELDLVKDYARQNGLSSFPDESALIVLLKSSWIELPSDKSYDDYVWIKADVPNFKKGDHHWKRNGWRPKVKLAMVGMHVAFTVKGHPELIWATFEHKDNSPNAQYHYHPKVGTKPNEPNCGKWLFASGRAEPHRKKDRSCFGIPVESCEVGQAVNAKGACVPANERRAQIKNGEIHSDDGKTIGPSEIVRRNPWGNTTDRPTFTTKIISINRSVQERLARNDVRKNYFLIGATWLANPRETAAADMVLECEFPAAGSNCVANSTLETFQQPSNCLNCHRAADHMPNGISRFYNTLDPLFPPRP